MRVADLRSEFLRPGQGPIWLISFGHGTTHWVLGTFYVALPFVATDLDLSFAEAGFLLTCFYAASFVTNLFSGALVDMTGRRLGMQIAALLLGSGAITAFSLSEHYLALCAAIAMLGCSNTLWHAPAISDLSRRCPDRRAYALSIHALVASCAEAVAPIFAGVLLLYLAWQGTTALAAVPSLIAVVMLLMLLPRSGDENGGGAVSRMSGKDYRAGLAAVLRNRAAVGVALVSGLRSATQAGLFVFVPLQLAVGFGYGPLVVGAALAAMQVGGLLAGPIAGVIADRIGPKPVVMAGVTVTSVVTVFLVLAAGPLLFILGVGVIGFALFAIRPVMQAWVLHLVPPEMAATGTSLLFGAQAGMAMLSPLLGGIVAEHYGLSAVFWLYAGTILAANLALLGLRNASPGQTPS